MAPLISAIVLLAGLVGQIYAASTSTKATPTTTVKVTTTTPTRTKTTCPQWYTTKISPSPTNAACGFQGSLSKPAKITSDCYDFSPIFRGEDDCYRSCVNTAGCVSYGYDRYDHICDLYSKPLNEMGLHTNETSMFFSSLRGCYVCNQDPVPVRPQCSTTPKLKSASQTKGSICGKKGVVKVPGDVIYYQDFFAGPSADVDCYNYCLELDKMGLCKSYQFKGDPWPPTCEVFAESLADKQWVADDDGPLSYDLRGCYECDLPPAKVSTSTTFCTPTHYNPTPTASNADFQQIDKDGDYVVPTNWGAYNADPHITSQTRSNGNRFVQLTTNGPVVQIDGYVNYYNTNPYQKTRFYNLTFDFAVVNYTIPANSKYKYCELQYDELGALPSLKLSDKKYRLPWKRLGPFTIDASNDLYSNQYKLSCSPAQPYDEQVDPNLNVTVWIDTISWSQNGKIVAGVGVGKPAS